MNEIDKTEILFIGQNNEMVATAAKQLKGEFRISSFVDDTMALEHLNTKPVRVVVSFHKTQDENGTNFCRRAKSKFFDEPFQIVAIVRSGDESRVALDSGADDVLLHPVGIDELRVRIHSAIIRLHNQIRIYGERNFFKRAVKKEEELSSKILDKHIVLKEAFQSIEAINTELEETNRKLKKVARFDVLSGLLNRLSLFTAMDSEIERAHRMNTFLSGIMMDIDHFKAINDNFGHLHGDRVIAEIGHRLRSLLRKYDLAGRYGGEEFFIILPNTNSQQSKMIAERFRLQLQDNPVRFDTVEMTITASFGVAVYRKEESRESWISRADGNMYNAKQSGRNRVFTD